MTRLLWPLSVRVVCLPVAFLATGVSLPFLHSPPGLPQPVPVPAGDQELAWFHTTTSGTTWERFVTGVARAQLQRDLIVAGRPLPDGVPIGASRRGTVSRGQ